MEIVDLCDDSDDDDYGHRKRVRTHANSHRAEVTILNRNDRVVNMNGSTRMSVRSPDVTADALNWVDRCSTICSADADFTVPRIDSTFSIADDSNLMNGVGIERNGLIAFRSDTLTTHVIESPESGRTKYPESPESMESIETIECPASPGYQEPSGSPESPHATESCPPESTVSSQLVESPESPSPELPQPPSIEFPESPSLESPESPSLESPESPPLESPKSPLLESPEPPPLESYKSPLLESPESPPLESPESPPPELPHLPSSLLPQSQLLESPASPSPESPFQEPPDSVDSLESPAVRSPDACEENVLNTTIDRGDPEINCQSRIKPEPMDYDVCDKTDRQSVRYPNMEMEPPEEQDPLAGIEMDSELDLETTVRPSADDDNDLDFIPTFNCLYCNFTTSVEHAYHTHLVSHLPGSKPYKRLYCPECDYTTGTSKYLMFHRIRSHSVVNHEKMTKLQKYLAKKKKKSPKKVAVKKEV